MRITRARGVSQSFLRTDQRSQAHRLHHAQDTLVINRLRHRITQRCCDSPTSIAPLVLVIDSANSGSHVALQLSPLDRLALIVERAISKACDLQQINQLIMMPQPGYQARFVYTGDRFDRINDCSYFRHDLPLPPDQ